MKRVSHSQGRRSRQARGSQVQLFSVALVSVVATIAGLRFMAPAQERERTIVVPDYDTVSLPVPKALVAAGARAQDIAVTLEAFPAHQIPRGTVRTIAEIYDGVATADLPAGVPLFSYNFSFEKSSRNPVLERIPEGKRAITLKVDIASAVEGWAGSGSHVDVLLVMPEKTIVIAEDVEVLSAERSVDPVSGDSAPAVPKTVTLLVDQTQTLAITTALPRGRLAFALRRSDDTRGWSVTEYTAEQLVGAPSELTDRRDGFSGYVQVQGDSGSQGYTLYRGKWIKTGQPPVGALIENKEGG